MTKTKSAKARSRRNAEVKRHVRDICPTPTKTGFVTRTDAKYALSKIWKRNSRPGTLPSRTYKCSCGVWHLASAPKR